MRQVVHVIKDEYPGKEKRSGVAVRVIGVLVVGVLMI